MLSVATRDELAADLAQAERSGEPIPPLTAAYPDIDVVDAYEIQLINIRQRVAEGARVHVMVKDKPVSKLGKVVSVKKSQDVKASLDVEVGMRLEALDRKNPRLVCKWGWGISQ